MAQPQAYNRETDFTERDGDDTNHAGINTELDAAALSINEIRENLALIQRDDGALQNGIVTAESLAPTAFDAFKGDLNEAVADAQTAATSANNAALSANTARDQAVAAKDTAVTSANAAALNATTATTKAAESAASATASQASATASANSASASQTSRLASETARDAALAAQAAASASQTAAAASQTAAATSETNAATSATTATTQAGTATTKASEASASAAAAAASFDQFEDRYLGSKTSDPTTDNDGGALLSGALYFNSVAGEMRVWADTFWKATGSSVGGTINTAKYTATAGQTAFPIVYDVGFVHVYQNGVKLESGVDFTANNGTSVVLTTGAVAGDVVDMIAFGIFSVANTYTKAEADALLAGKLATTAGAVGTSNLADGVLAATVAGLAKMADGFLQATTAGLAKMADGFLAATTAGRAKMADGFITPAKMQNGGAEFGMVNRIINGRMEVNQRSVTSVSGGSEVYTLDRWIVANYFLSGAISVAQSSDAPAGFSKSLLVTNGTGEALSATDYGTVRQKIEGNNFADMAWGTASAKPITISFWVKSSVAGNYTVGLINGGVNRANRTVFTINATNTWEQKTVTFVGDTSGTWATDNSVGLYLDFVFVAGSNQHATADTWTANSLEGVSGASANWVTSTGATFQVSGVDLRKGTYTSAPAWDWRPYGVEDALCKRYFYQNTYVSGDSAIAATGYWGSGITFEGFIKFPVTMRAIPTLSYSGSVQALKAQTGWYNVNSAGLNGADYDSGKWGFTTDNSGEARGVGGMIGLKASGAYIRLNAEL